MFKSFIKMYWRQIKFTNLICLVKTTKPNVIKCALGRVPVFKSANPVPKSMLTHSASYPCFQSNKQNPKKSRMSR